MTERVGDFSVKGNSMTVLGDKLKIGDRAPDFALATDLFSMDTATLAETTGKIRLINVVPSLNTGLCDAQTRRFSEEIGKFEDKVVGYTVSVDLPRLQKSWCEIAGVDNMRMLSDYRTMSFGDTYGTHVKDLRIEQRSVFVVDADGIIRYAEYVPELGQHPNYDAALAALNELAG